MMTMRQMEKGNLQQRRRLFRPVRCLTLYSLRMYRSRYRMNNENLATRVM